MESLKQKAIDIAAKMVNQMGDFELLGWPPSCVGIGYQPERPMRPAPMEPSAVEEKEESCT